MRGRTRLVAILVLAIAVGAAGAAGAARYPGRAAADLPPSHADRVVVVGVAGLGWSDVSAGGTPALAGLARQGAIGALSVRSATTVTCPGEGWLTLGAGDYAALVDPDVAGGASCAARQAPAVPATGPAVPSMPELRDRNDRPRLGARPGALGEAVSCTTAIGPGAALAAADADGAVDHYRPALPADLAGLLARCPFTAIDLGSITGGAARQHQLRAFDRRLARVRDQLPADSVLVVAGIAETDGGQPRLHVAVAHGPGFGLQPGQQPGSGTGPGPGDGACEPPRARCDAGWLWSPSTQRPPYVQLADLAPTVLAVLGTTVPDDLAGRPLLGGGAGRPAALPDAVTALVDLDTQAVAHRSALGEFFAALGVLLLVAFVAAVWQLRHPRSRRGVRVAALGLAAVPAASFVAHLVPWWRAPAPTLAVAAATALGAVAVLAVMLAVVPRLRERRSPPLAALGALGALTVAVFAADALTGARLQLGSLLGYNPLVAGRFIGFGNIAFAVYAVGAVLLAAAVAATGRPWVRLAAVAVPVVAVTGAPWWGADFGGVLTLVPTFVVLGLLLTRVRVTWWRLGAAGLAGIGVVLAISWLDYLRPASARTHFGRFAGSLLDGSAVATVHRKLLANLELLTMGPHTIAGALLVVAGAVAVLRPPAALARAYQTWPATRPVLTATVALAGFGFATNDSGIAIPVVIGLVMLPAVLALCLWAAADPPEPVPHGAAPAVASGPALTSRSGPGPGASQQPRQGARQDAAEAQGAARVAG